MQNLPLPLARDVVLIGGGHTHALFLRRWGMKPVPGARLTVINPAPTAPYTGMLPNFVAGHYDRDALEIDLVRLARFAGARIVLGWATGIDRTAREVHVEGRPPLPYDIASVDIGITSTMPEIPGFSDHGVAAKPLGPFAARWSAFLQGDAGDVVVIGGGVAGVELALTMSHALQGRGKVTVVEANRVLNATGDRARDALLGHAEAAGISFAEGATVTAVGPDTITLSDDRRLPASLTVGAAGARPFPWLEETGLDLTDGFITVDAHLRAINDPTIYATGDCAHLSHAPRPKAGVFAVREAPVLTHNIRADLTGTARRRFDPQKHYLKLVSLGPKSALAEKWGHAVGGPWAWTWKDRIDRSFMERLNNPPAMAAPPVPKGAALGVTEALGPKPLCGGCGAKVGPAALDHALASLTEVQRDDVETGTGDDAAVLNIGGTRQVLSTDHLRAVWDDPYVMARIAAVHALGDVWSMGAAPQAVLTQITLPRMAERMQDAWLSEIMKGAGDIFAAEGAAVVGGHTTLGAELVIGFTVTGLLEDKALTLAGAREGDALVLTRPIGSGTLLAAEMEGKAKGEDIAALLATMSTSQGDAARLLAPRAHAMTDVTGFGLAGHLARMADASGLTGEIALDALPLFSGAEALAASGLRSSIWTGNRAAVDATLPDTPRAALLFDPQTSGGLLAAVPEDEARGLLASLQGMGHTAARIGTFAARGSVSVKAR